MASTGILQHQVLLDTPLGTFEVRRLELEESVRAPMSGVVELRRGEDPGFDGLVDGDVQVVVLRSGDEVRRFSVRVARVVYKGLRDGAHAFDLEFRDAFWFQRFVKNVRKFRDKTAQEIIATILNEAGVAHRFELTRDTFLRPFTVQYRESNFDFVTRLLEYEGIFRRIEDDGSLVFFDRSSASPEASSAPLELVWEGAGLVQAEEALTSFSRGARVGSGKATVNDYDWKKPDKVLLQSKAGSRDVDLEVYDFPAGYRDEGQGQTLVRLRLEALECEKRFVRGTSNVSMLRAGTHFSFSHSDGIEHGGAFFLVAVVHRFEWVGEGLTARFANRFNAIPLAVPYRPPLVVPAPEMHGLQTAIVRGPPGEEIHTDAFGRFRAQFHWDREAKGTDEDSRWMRMAQETSSSLVLQRVGWEASIAFVAGDPERPVGVSRNINGQMIPTYSQPTNQNVMTIRTSTYPGKQGANEIRMDDTAGAQHIRVTAQRNVQSSVRHDQRETIGHDELHTVGTNLSARVGGNQKLEVGRNERVDVDIDDRHSVGKNRSVTIGDNETVKVKGSFTVSVHRNDSEKVGSVRTSIVGGIKLPTLPNPMSLLSPQASSHKKRPNAPMAGGPDGPMAGGPMMDGPMGEGPPGGFGGGPGGAPMQAGPGGEGPPGGFGGGPGGASMQGGPGGEGPPGGFGGGSGGAPMQGGPRGEGHLGGFGGGPDGPPMQGGPSGEGPPGGFGGGPGGPRMQGGPMGGGPPGGFGGGPGGSPVQGRPGGEGPPGGFGGGPGGLPMQGGPMGGGPPNSPGGFAGPVSNFIGAPSSGPGAASAGFGPLSQGVKNPASMLPNPQSILPNPQAMLGSLKPTMPTNLASMFHGTISRSAGILHQITVGGAHVAIAGGNVTHLGGKLLAEIVGGTKDERLIVAIGARVSHGQLHAGRGH